MCCDFRENDMADSDRHTAVPYYRLYQPFRSMSYHLNRESITKNGYFVVI